MPTRITTVEKFVPAVSDRIPAFGVIFRDEEDQEGVTVVLVFGEGTPLPCQDDVCVELRERLTGAIPDEHVVSRLVQDRLDWHVTTGQLRKNKFTQKWVWLGEEH